ncbi:MAG: DUF1080 domain-containing protein, partial [Pirellulaceae bacterium]|nr:DUF1080 domain-containing protein [Pirellulaceae bacterium]
MHRICTFVVVTLCSAVGANAGEPTVLFDGKHLDQWDFREGGWVIDDDGAMTCRMDTVSGKDGKQRVKGSGYIWTRRDYQNFVLTLSYKLSAGANSGVFYRT